jgi:hypothetical protein
MGYLETKAQAAYNNAQKTYEESIGTRICFEQLLDGIPADDVKLYNQVRAGHEESIQCINAAWKAKLAAEAALDAVLGK